MNRNTWKNFERELAKMFGGVRTPLSGGNSKITRSDVIHNCFYIEAKMRTTNNVWEKWYKIKAEKTPILALKNLWIIKSTYFKEMPAKMRENAGKIKVFTVKSKGLETLFKDTEQKAELEGKIPIVALKLLNKKGFFIVFKKIDYGRIKRNGCK